MTGHRRKSRTSRRIDGSGRTPPDASHDRDTKAIERILATMQRAWNRGDAKGFASRFAADGTFVNHLGMIFHGHEAFEQRHAELFRGFALGTKAKVTTRSRRFIRPDVAIIEVDVTTTGFGVLPPGLRPHADGTLRGLLQLVFVREKHDWWITAYHSVSIGPSVLPPEMVL